MESRVEEADGSRLKPEKPHDGARDRRWKERARDQLPFSPIFDRVPTKINRCNEHALKFEVVFVFTDSTIIQRNIQYIRMCGGGESIDN